MEANEAARSIHHVELDKSDEKRLGNGRENGYGHMVKEEQELFLSSVEPAQQDKIFRKVRCLISAVFEKVC